MSTSENFDTNSGYNNHRYRKNYYRNDYHGYNKYNKYKKNEYRKIEKGVSLEVDTTKEKSGKSKNLVDFGSQNERKEQTTVTPKENIPKRSSLIKSSIVGHIELSSKIISDLISNKYDCSICMFTIKKNTAVWSCSRCYGIWHVYCAKKWAKSNAEKPKITPWNCPKCRTEYIAIPDSWCFCGKVKNPNYNPMHIPHTCGLVCKKKREGTTCPHPCTLLCHPGPCPPCGAMGKFSTCFCGKSQYRLKCGVVDNGMSCNMECKKVLNCGKHTCNEICHSGECKECNIKYPQKCYCGKLIEERLCGTELVDTSVYGDDDPRTFSCKEMCGRTLSCGNHRCERECHSGPCDPCSLDPLILKTCGCGRTELIGRKICTDPVISCGALCGKILKCGHKCKQKCHIGECSSCSEQIEEKCRCSTSSRKIVCGERNNLPPFTCNRSCLKLKSCGRHQCSVKCCPVNSDPTDPEGFHVCHTVCNKRLTCGKHNCKNLCHKGACPPCLEAEFEDKTCSCGKTVQLAPIRCGTPPLECKYPCTKQLACGHPKVEHQCHEGDCPPCVYLTEKKCHCGKTVLENIKCFSKAVFCGKKCSRLMSCGIHTCQRECHIGPCEKNENLENEEGFKSCGFKCGKKRSTCEHTCQTICHLGECPDTLCTLLSKISCKCGRKSEEVQCIGDKIVTLECDKDCDIEIRNKKLKEAFGIIGTNKKPPKYSLFLLSMATNSPEFTLKIENLFHQFLLSKSTVYETQPYDNIQRRYIHELCKYYNLVSDSSPINQSLRKTITISKTNDSQLPTVLLSDIAGIKRKSNELSTTILLYDLNIGVKTEDIIALLYDFKGEFNIQWIDTESCLIIFYSHYKMMRALNSLHTKGEYKAKIYTESESKNSTPNNPIVEFKNDNPELKNDDETEKEIEVIQEWTD